MTDQYTKLAVFTLTAKRDKDGRVLNHITSDFVKDIPEDTQLTYPEMLGILGSALFALGKKPEYYQDISFDVLLHHLLNGYQTALISGEVKSPLELVK